MTNFFKQHTMSAFKIQKKSYWYVHFCYKIGLTLYPRTRNYTTHLILRLLYNKNKIKNALEFLCCGIPQRQHKCFQIAIVSIDCSLNSEYDLSYRGQKLPEVAFELSYSWKSRRNKWRFWNITEFFWRISKKTWLWKI